MHPAVIQTARSILAVILALSFFSTTRADIISNLENYYSFNDPLDPARDDSGNARHGTISGATWVNDELMGGAMQFNANAFVGASLPNLNLNGAFTVAMWANLTSPLSGNRGLYQVQNGGTVPTTGTKVLGGWVGSNGTIWGRIIDTAGQKDLSSSGPPTLTPGAWTHIAYRGDGSSYQRFVNGVALGPAVAYNGTLAAHDMLFIGRQGTESAIGRIDDFRVYSRALSQSDLEELVRAALPGDALRVDFGQTSGGLPNGPYQPGWYTFEAAETGGEGGPDVTKTYGSALGAGGMVNVTLGGYTHFRDYAAITSGPFVNQTGLLSDMVLRYSNGTMRLTLGNLQPGIYDMTTYHHSTQFGGGTFSMNLSDLTGTGQTLFTGVPVTAGQGPASISTRTFRVVTDGSPVAVDFLGGTGSQHLSLNGFQLAPAAMTLKIDFGSSTNSGGGPGGLQDGSFYPFEATEGGGNPDILKSFYSPIGAGGIIDVTVGGYTHFRDYTAATGFFAGQSALLSDSVLRNSDGALRLTLANLQDGWYNMKTYHHATQFGDTRTFDLTLTDGERTGLVVATGVPMSTNASTSLSSLTFLVMVRNGSPVIVDFATYAGSGHFALDGFEVSVWVPEPGTLLLAALGLLLAAPIACRRPRAA